QHQNQRRCCCYAADSPFSFLSSEIETSQGIKKGPGCIQENLMSHPTLKRAFLLLVLIGIAESVAPGCVAQTVGPVFSTQTPVTGLMGNLFVAFVPLANTGTSTATNVMVKSVTLGLATPTSPGLPV